MLLQTTSGRRATFSQTRCELLAHLRFIHETGLLSEFDIVPEIHFILRTVWLFLLHFHWQRVFSLNVLLENILKADTMIPLLMSSHQEACCRGIFPPLPTDGSRLSFCGREYGDEDNRRLSSFSERMEAWRLRNRLKKLIQSWIGTLTLVIVLV